MPEYVYKVHKGYRGGGKMASKDIITLRGSTAIVSEFFDIMASNLNGLSVGASLADNIMESPARSESASCFRNGCQKMDKIKDSNRQFKQLEDLTGKMRECKRLINEFDRILKDEEKKNPAKVNKQLNDKKQFMIKELTSYVTLRKTYQSSLGNKRIELFDTGNDQVAEDNI